MNLFEAGENLHPELISKNIEIRTLLRKWKLFVEQQRREKTWSLDEGFDHAFVLFQHELDRSDQIAQSYANSLTVLMESSAQISSRLTPDKIAWAYAAICCASFVQECPDFLTIDELIRLTGYSSNRIRTLIREGKVVGEETEDGWMGDPNSLAEYQQENLGVGSRRHPRS